MPVSVTHAPKISALTVWCLGVKLTAFNLWKYVGRKKPDKTPISLSVSSSYWPKVSSPPNSRPWKEPIPYLAAVVGQKPASVQHIPGLRIPRHISPPS